MRHALLLLKRLRARRHAHVALRRAKSHELAAPSVTSSGTKLDWSKVGKVAQYVVASKATGLETTYSVVTGTSTTPPAQPGTTVHYSVRTNVVGSAWSDEVPISYPTKSTAGSESTATTSAEESAEASATGVGTVEAPSLSITGTTYYVSKNGSDSNNGLSPGSAWRTVGRVDEAELQPGDGVLFEGGASFADEVLMPATSGAVGAPIVFGSYGSGNAELPLGVWFKGKSHLGFEHLTIGPEGNLQGTGEDVVVEWCSIGNDSLAINATGVNSNWVIDDNSIDHTTESGMLLEGDRFKVSGNTITNTGLDSSIPYGKHGIYLKVSNATVTKNTITNFSADGISVRYRNSFIKNNSISGGAIGIAWFQYDTVAGTSYWSENTISNTTEADIYVSSSDIGGETRESFVITKNVLKKLAGTYLDLRSTQGTYTLSENLFG